MLCPATSSTLTADRSASISASRGTARNRPSACGSTGFAADWASGSHRRPSAHRHRSCAAGVGGRTTQTPSGRAAGTASAPPAHRGPLPSERRSGRRAAGRNGARRPSRAHPAPGNDWQRPAESPQAPDLHLWMESDAAGRPDTPSGRRGPGFKSRHPDHKHAGQRRSRGGRLSRARRADPARNSRGTSCTEVIQGRAGPACRDVRRSKVRLQTQYRITSLPP